MNFIQRLSLAYRAFRNGPTPGILWGGGVEYGSGMYGQNRDLTADKFGAALAQRISIPVYRGVDVWVRETNGLGYGIRDTRTGDSIEDSQSVDLQHPLMRAIRDVFVRNGYSIFGYWIMSLKLAGEAFIEPMQSDLRPSATTGLEPLNPLAVTIQAPTGLISGFLYNGQGRAVRFDRDELIYDRYAYMMSDVNGLSPVEAAIRSVNVSANVQRAALAIFRNGAVVPTILSPQDQVLDEDWQNFREHLKNNHKGVDRWGRILAPNFPVNVDELDFPDVEKFVDVENNVDKKIYTALGVPMALAGDTTGTQYKESLESVQVFYRVSLIPEVNRLERVINSHVMPRFDKSGQHEFFFATDDLLGVTEQDKIKVDIATQKETSASNVVAQLYTSGIITRNEARQKVGFEPLPDDSQPPAVTGDDPPTPPPTPNETANQQLEALPSDYEPTEEQGDELRAWQKKVRNKGKRAPFEVRHLRAHVEDYVRDALAMDDPDVSAVFRYADILQRLKAIQATRLEFENTLEDIIAEARTGNLTRRRFGTILRNQIEVTGRKAFRDGLIDGGVADASMDDEDEETVQNITREQRQYVSGLQNQIYDGGLTDEQAAAKPAMWFNKSIQPFYQAGLGSADKNGYYEWVYGDTEHCSDCLALNGQIHRMRDYQRTGWLPKASQLECNGFNCECNLVKRPGARARGRFPRKSVHIHTHEDSE